MDEVLQALMTVITPPPPNYAEHASEALSFLYAAISLPPPRNSLHFRHFSEDRDTYKGRDVFGVIAGNRYQFFQLTGETPETFIELENIIYVYADREHHLSPINRTLLFVIWLRSYPTYHCLGNMFNISVATASNEITALMPIYFNKLSVYVVWPSVAQWRALSGTWGKIPVAVGAIDGTSHRIYRPIVEPQEQYYSGHRHYHCIHTQVVVDARGIIRHVDSGFVGHLNDAQQFGLMEQIGTDPPFPPDVLLLADKIYRNGGSVMTPFTRPQLLRKPPGERRKCRKFNRYISMYRVRVEHAIAELKTYKCVSSTWRHPRRMLN